MLRGALLPAGKSKRKTKRQVRVFALLLYAVACFAHIP
jgi:hypothetical protein